MFTRLYDKFPGIRDIRKDTLTRQLIIFCESPTYKHKFSYDPKIENGKEEMCSLFSLRITCVNARNSAEPYTQETLDKALIEFPVKYKEEISRIKEDPDFVAFVDYIDN